MTEQNVRQRPIGLPHNAVHRVQVVYKIRVVGKASELSALKRTSAVTYMVVSADNKPRVGHRTDKALALISLDIFAHAVRYLQYRRRHRILGRPDEIVRFAVPVGREKIAAFLYIAHATPRFRLLYTAASTDAPRDIIVKEQIYM